MTSEGPKRLDRYDLLAEIASGGMATVYLGRLAGAGGFQRLVAIKRLHPHLEREKEFVEMFLDEARIAAQLHHPNVVSTLEVGTSERGYFLVMDYVEGDTLAKLFTKAAASPAGMMPRPVALRIIVDTLAGLQAAHDLKDEAGQSLELVHRDVSPQNILVSVGGTARITDFGVARAAARLSSTRSGQLKGKLGYMAPEQARGESVDRRSDLFAMGVILWEAVVGKRLFRGKQDTDAETLHRVLYEPIPPLRDKVPDVPAELEAVCATALEREMGQRFASCSELADALETLARKDIIAIATHREVARYVDELVGKDVVERRERIRALTTRESADSDEILPTLADVVPRLTSSPSSVSLSTAAVASGPPSAPVSGNVNATGMRPAIVEVAQKPGVSLAVGLVAGATIAVLVVVAVLAFGGGAIGPRPPVVATMPPAPSAEVSAPVNSAPATTTAPAASTAPPVIIALSALPTATATPPPVNTNPGVGVRKPPPGKDPGLSTNPYR